MTPLQVGHVYEGHAEADQWAFTIHIAGGRVFLDSASSHYDFYEWNCEQVNDDH